MVFTDPLSGVIPVLPLSCWNSSRLLAAASPTRVNISMQQNKLIYYFHIFLLFICNKYIEYGLIIDIDHNDAINVLNRAVALRLMSADY